MYFVNVNVVFININKNSNAFRISTVKKLVMLVFSVFEVTEYS